MKYILSKVGIYNFIGMKNVHYVFNDYPFYKWLSDTIEKYGKEMALIIMFTNSMYHVKDYRQYN